MATIDVIKPVEKLPLTVISCNEEIHESMEPTEAAKPIEEAPLVVTKDIAQINFSGISGTPQKAEDSQGQKVEEHIEQLSLTLTKPMASISPSEQSKTSDHVSEPHTEKGKEPEAKEAHSISLEQPQNAENTTKQDPQPDHKVAKRATVEEDDESSSSEDEHKKAKGETKHTFGLSQAISSGFAGAAAGAASSLTGAATSAVLGAIHGKIGIAKPSQTPDKDAKKGEKSEKSGNAKPNGDASQATIIPTITTQDTAMKTEKNLTTDIRTIIHPAANIQRGPTANTYIPTTDTHTTMDIHMTRMTIPSYHLQNLRTKSQTIHTITTPKLTTIIEQILMLLAIDKLYGYV
ncbi:hypothetical protein N431DRAFT_528985 [Stipitochalara longipes BDJ]|nr:hypothetical protein N431DRAFT_528985 [Stipitochalara longipes BDJ]